MPSQRRSIAIALGTVAVVLLGMTAAGPALADPGAPQPTWGVNGRVLDIVSSDGAVYVAGSFTDAVGPAGQLAPVSNLARFEASDGTYDPTWVPTTDGLVTSMAVSGDTLYLGGTFTEVDGVPRKRLAAVDLDTGAVIGGWDPGVNGEVNAVAVIGSQVYAGGNFTKVTDDDGTYAQPYIARFDPVSGLEDRTWAPLPNDNVRAILGSSDGTEVYLGGDFTSVNGLTMALRSVLVTGDTGAVDRSFDPGTNNLTAHAPVYSFASNGTDLIEASAGSGGGCTDLDAATGATLWSVHTNGNVQSVVLMGSTAYCGGHFSGTNSFGGLTRSKLAGVDLATGTVTDLDPTINSALGVWSLAADETNLYVGGDFTVIDKVDQPHFAILPPATELTAPTAPQGVTAQPGDPGILLSWSAPDSNGGSPILRYAVFRATGEGKAKKLGTTKTMSYADPTAVDGTTYTYTVEAINAIGTGPASDPVVATPESGEPVAPDPPQALAVQTSATSLTLTWSTPDSTGGSPITGYQVLRGSAPGNETPLALLGPTTSYVDTDVIEGTTYYYTVEAVNAVGSSDPSNEVSATPAPGLPAAPVLIGTPDVGAIDLSWTAPDDNGSPLIRYAIVRDGIRIANVSPDQTSYVDLVDSGSMHSYQVRAVNGVGASKYSNTVTVTAS